MGSEATVTTIPALFPGDLVCIQDQYAQRTDHGIVFEIVKVNPRNWNINPINGDGLPLRCPPELLRKATAEEIEAARAEVADRRPPLRLAQVVEVSGNRWRESPDKLWIVTKVHADGGADVAEFGPNTRRTCKKLPRGMINPLPDEAVNAMLTAARSARS